MTKAERALAYLADSKVATIEQLATHLGIEMHKVRGHVMFSLEKQGKVHIIGWVQHPTRDQPMAVYTIGLGENVLRPISKLQKAQQETIKKQIPANELPFIKRIDIDALNKIAKTSKVHKADDVAENCNIDTPRKIQIGIQSSFVNLMSLAPGVI